MKQQEILFDEDGEFMKKYGPKDVCYAASFDKNNLPEIRKIIKQDPHYYFQLCEKHYNDHKNKLFLAVSKADDLVTYIGLSFCARLILGQTFTRWQYFGAGTSDMQARPYQQTLFGEVTPRCDMFTNGNVALTAGHGIQFAGIFASTFPTISVKESAVFTGSGAGAVMFCRNVFGTSPVNHTINVTGFTLASLITFVPVTTWE